MSHRNTQKSDTLSLWSIFSVWNRNFQVYRKTWIFNCIPPLTEPLVLLLGFGLGLSPLIGAFTYRGNEVSYLEFLAPGMIAMGLASQAYFEAAFSIFVRIQFQKTWHALLTAPISFTDVFIGEILWASSRGVFAALITGLVSTLFGLIPLWVVFAYIPFYITCALVFAALGACSAGFVRGIDQLNIPIFLFIIPMFTLCGAYFPREELPQILSQLTHLLPFSSLADLLRIHLLHSQSIAEMLRTSARAVIIALPWGIAFGIGAYYSLRKKVLR